MITDADCAWYDEVHLQYFFFFVENDIFVILIREIARHKSEGNIVEELAVLVFLGIEENPEIVENIIE